MSQNPENFYETLKIDRSATTSEIVAAYQAAKAAFSKDSVATYSLFSNEEIQEILQNLEQAYMTLSNLEKKREYDRWLDGGEAPEVQREPVAQIKAEVKMANESVATPVTSEKGSILNDVNLAEVNPPVSFSGTELREAREKRGLSVDDVARITKIPAKFVKAIENHDMKNMPARVYIQGFIKNLCAVYKLDPQSTARSYLEYLDRSPTAN